MMIYKYSLSSLFLFFSPSSFPPFFLPFLLFCPRFAKPQAWKNCRSGNKLTKHKILNHPLNKIDESKAWLLLIR